MHSTGMSDAKRQQWSGRITHGLVSQLARLDPHTHSHSARVARLSVYFGMKLGLCAQELVTLQAAGLLHDIGKLRINRRVLRKPGPLTRRERCEIQRHPQYGFEMLAALPNPALREITLKHHERLDGKGYPHGIRELPLLVRVLQIADAWDGLGSHRPYCRAIPSSRIRRMLSSPDNDFGFDPELLERFLALTTRVFPDYDSIADQSAA